MKTSLIQSHARRPPSTLLIAKVLMLSFYGALCDNELYAAERALYKTGALLAQPDRQIDGLAMFLQVQVCHGAAR